MTKLSSLWDAALAASLVNPHLIISVDRAWRAHEAQQNELKPDRYRAYGGETRSTNVRFSLVQKGIIRPCVPTPLVKVGDNWVVGVPLYDKYGIPLGYATEAA